MRSTSSKHFLPGKHLCICIAETMQGNMLGVKMLISVHWQKKKCVLTMWKLACFTRKHTSENSLGSDSLCSVVNALYKLGNSLQGTLLGFLTKSASPRTPWFLLPCMGMTPHSELPVYNTDFMENISVSSGCICTAGTMQGSRLAVKMLIWSLWTKTLFTPSES